jgi:hypothetical protein
MPLSRVAVLAVWVLTLVGVVVVVALVPGAAALAWLALALPLAIVVAIAGQLAVAEQQGFVVRLSAAATGSFVLVVLGAGVALLA